MYPHERSLVKKFEGKPFVILGVNSDPKDHLNQVIKKEKMTWRSWWDGGDTEGPISKVWNVHGWPTVYIIDAKGIIRAKNVGEGPVENVIETLLKEIAPAKR
jgi:peroxiredoxin